MYTIQKDVQMKKKIIFMFSGQGSQYYHMGKELYEHHARFKYWMDHCDEIAYPFVKTSLVDVLYHTHNKTEPFDQILHTNPALFCIEYSLSRVLIEMGLQPDYLLGYSLGEIAASVASGVMTLEEGIRLVFGMATLVKEKTPLAQMLAIIESQEIMSDLPHLFENCWVTGKNFQGNFVVSGLPDSIQQIKRELDQRNKISQVLPVRYGFHTELIDPIEEEFKKIVRGINLSSIEKPILSSLKAETVHEVDEDYYWDVIRQPVNFEETVTRILNKDDYIFIDAGPSGSLATFVKYILPQESHSLQLQMINQFGRDLNSMEKMKDSLSGIMDGCI
jgi:bacillaene synthase trans-acting acyltransferase